MKAIRCCDKHKIKVVDVPEPSGEGVRVKVRSSGICGSDLHMINMGFAIPGTLGHEVAGELSDGRAVALQPLSPCGHCDMCVGGDYGNCRTGAAMVHGVGRDGGMAEQIVVPESALVALPSHVPVTDACLVEPLAVAVHGIRMLDISVKSHIAVIGAGPVGLSATAVLAPFIGEVGLAARHAAQMKAGERLGAKLDPVGEYDVVIDCAGNDASLAQAASLCRPNGVILLLATYWQGVSLPAFEVSMKNLKIYASSMYSQKGLSRDVDVAAQVLAKRPEIADIMITHRLPLEAAVEAFEIAADRKAGAIKVVLEP
jgi:threonine dehydrogenase-like Zn-dependent dehydrogenase